MYRLVGWQLNDSLGVARQTGQLAEWRQNLDLKGWAKEVTALPCSVRFALLRPLTTRSRCSPTPTNPRRCVQVRGIEKKYRAMQGQDDVKHMKKMLAWSYVLYAVGLATSAPTPPDAQPDAA